MSLIYFDGIFSHAVKKTPCRGDFKVQGGKIELVVAEKAMQEKGLKILRQVPNRKTIFERIDFCWYQEEYVCTEIEMIDPELFLRKGNAVETFGRAILKRMEKGY